MTNRRGFIVTATAGALLLSSNARSAWWDLTSNDSEALVITWDDLIPSDFVQPKNPFDSMSKEEIDRLMDGSPESAAEIDRLREAYNYSPVVESLDGRRVKLGAYITPLEFDGQSKLSEFLLVPYVGACMHVPPPPANQVVHANSEDPVKRRSMYEAVWAIGTLRTETVESELAESGYRLEVEEVLPYSTE